MHDDESQNLALLTYATIASSGNIVSSETDEEQRSRGAHYNGICEPSKAERYVLHHAWPKLSVLNKDLQGIHALL